MKNFNLIKRLWVDSHEKHLPQRFGHYAAILIMLLTLGVGQMWGWSFNNDNFIYFHNKGGWSDSGKMLFIGKDSYSSVYTMSAVTGNSSLWVVKLSNEGWSDATYMAVAGGSSVWGSGSWGPGNRTNATHYTNTYTSGLDASNNQRYMLTPANGSNNANLSLDYLGTGEPNYTITVKAKVSINGGSYSEATSPGTLSASSKKFTAYNSCNSTTSLSSGTITCGYYATTTLTAADATGYDFIGWYDSSGTRQTTSKTLTIYPTANATYYAYYKEKRYNVTAVASPAAGGSVTPTSATAMGQITGGSITATPNDGYTFGGWSGGTGSFVDASSANTTFKPTAASTVTAGFSAINYSITYNNMTGATNHASNPSTYTIESAAITLQDPKKTGYLFDGWYTDEELTTPVGTPAIAAGSTGNKVFYAKWTEITLTEVSASPSTGGTGVQTMTVSFKTNVPRNSGYYYRVVEFGGVDAGTTGGGFHSNGNLISTGDAATLITSASFSTINFATSGVYTSAIEIYTDGPITVQKRVTFTYGAGNYYTVSFNMQGHGSDIDNQVILSGSYADEPDAPSETGYTFGGWYKEAACTNAWNFASDAVTSDKTLFAKWTANQYTITFDKEGGSGGSDNVTVYYDATLGAFATAPTRTGYTFAGYWTGDNGTGTMLFAANGAPQASVGSYTDGSVKWIYAGNPTVYAKWTENTTTVTVNVSPAKSGTLTVGGSAFTPGNTITAGVATSRTVVASANSGYGFDYWTTSGNATGSASTNTYTLAGNGNGSTGTLTANFYTKVNSGWYMKGAAFGGWDMPTTYPFDRAYRDVANTYYRIVTLTASSYWKVHNGTTTYNTDGSNSSDKLVDKNTVYSLTSNNSKSSYTNTTMTDVWVVVNTSTKKLWIQDAATYYTITFANGSSGNTNNGAAGTEGTITTKTSNYGELSTKKFASGETIKLNVSAKTGYVIDDITIGETSVVTDVNSTSYSVNATMPAGDATLTVTYKHNYTVTYGVGTSYTSMGSVSSSPAHTSGQKVIEGTSMTFTATPNLGYKFVGWYREAACTNEVSTDNPYEQTINANTTLYAKYELLTLYMNSDINNWASEINLTHTTENAAIYTYTGTLNANPTNDAGTYASGWHFEYCYDAARNEKAYQYTSVQTPTYSGSSIDGVHTYSGANTIQFGLTRKSYVTITLTLQAAPAKPTVSISADPIYTITIAKSGPDAGFASLSPSAGSTVEARASVASSAVTVGVNTGYTRTDWTATSGITITSASNNSTTVTATADGTLTANVRANTYTVAFNANDGNYVGEATGTTAPIENKAYNAASYTLTANGFSREGYTFAGWNTDPDGTSGTGYSNEQSITTPLTAEDGATVTLYAKWTGKTYTVSFNARGGSDLSSTSKSVTMGTAYGTLATVTPPAGYVFDGWYTSSAGGTKVTDETLVETASDHTLYAHYVQKAQVYFKNTLGWSKVYVTYDAYWDSGDPSKGSGNNGKTTHLMTLVTGTTDIYYDDIPDAILSSWKGSIVFYNEQQVNYNNFNKGQAVFRRDFDSDATMFVPVPNDPNKFTLNAGNGAAGTTYYSTDQVVDKSGDDVTNYRYKNGYWVRYNNVEAGYSLKGSWDAWVSDHYIAKETASGTTYTYTIRGLSANTNYTFKLFKHCAASNTYSSQFSNTGMMTSGNCSNWTFNAASTTSNAVIKTTVAGDYTFNFTFGDGEVKLSVDYPFYADDYKVVYSYTKDGAKTYESEIIKCRANGLDTISVFIHSGDSATSRSLTIEKCTNIDNSGVATWNTSYATITLPSETTSGKTSGVYNFIITQDGSAAASGAYWNKYTGNYYIRTAASDGGWDMYKYRPDNIMTLSEYSLTQTLSAPYSHYYCRYIESTTMDITYAVATDYSPNISGILVGDATIGGDGNKTLPASANVRFTWNQETNALRRAYLKSAQGSGNTRFLVLHGKAADNIFNADKDGTAIAADGDQSLAANELLFTDIGNWIYQINLKAKPKGAVSLIANYNEEDRYLIGGESSWMEIMGGSGSGKYEILAVFDFKTNRLMTVWTPSVAIGDDLKDVDMLLIRHAQNDATSVTFSGSGSLTTKKVYGAIKLDYNELVGHVAYWTTESRPLLKYMISFPFDVNISDIFGLNTRYGEAYVIQKYDGADRAARGFFRGDGTTTFWKDMEQNEVMRANVGYCVIFDNDYLNGDLGAIWENKSAESSVYLYFPSAGNVGTIASSTKNIEVTALPCNIDREFTVATRTLNHKYTDSNWNLIGVPIFQNSTGALEPATIASENTGDQTGSYGPFYYFYDYNVANNRYSIASAAGYNFKTMYSYMLQYAGTVTFTGSTPSSVAARRIADTKKYEIELQVLRNDEEVINRAFVNLKENACDTFALNEDVYMSPNSAAVNIYTLAGNYDVAANILSIDNHIVPVGVEVSKAGTYTFSMPSDFDGTVVLVDNFDGSRTDLSLGDYSVALPKGTIEDRFTLEINIERSSATDIEGIEGGTIKDGKAHKFVRDGIMYILRDGVIYDAMGKRVK